MPKGRMSMIEAGCHDCDWGSMARNAMGNAARHANAHGHRTWVEVVYEFGESGHRPVETAGVKEVPDA